MISNNYQFQILIEQEVEDDDRLDESEELCRKFDGEDPAVALDRTIIEVRVFFLVVIGLLHKH